MGNSSIKIRTPDQKIRVFVSSTLRELAEERKVARDAIETIYLIPVMFELGARPHPPKDLYQAYLRQSHIFIGIYWQSYGWIAENEKISGLEDELLLSEKFPRLIYVKEPAPEREEKLTAMLDYIRSRGNVSYKSFSTADELSVYIKEDLAILISERFYSEIESGKESEKSVHNNLPVNLSSLIGREKEISEICDLILKNNSHLITITGPGGIGKTRIAIAVGKSMEDYFQDGIYFADFSGVMDEKNIITELARAFGISLNSSVDLAIQIAEYIAEQKILLIIDNFEQLTNAGSGISAVVTKCPNLSVIITSRNPLELSIETEFNINALSFPDESYDFIEMKKSPSVMLFYERARSADKNFELTEINIYSVAEICRMLGGIPLAIELAAVKVRMFPVNTIKERLSKKLDLLSGSLKDAPARHKTMKAALEWSYDLLNEQEKILFRRLSVFVNGFDYEAIESICCYDMDYAYITIESLLTKNLFKKDIEENGVVRFSMLDLIHKFAIELFEQSGEAELIKTILAEYYLEKIRQESLEFYGAIEAKINSVWVNDIHNVMNALETLLEWRRYPEVIEMIYSLWPVFWIFDKDNILEKKIDLQKVLLYDENLSEDLRGKQSWIAGSDAMEKGDFETANSMFGIANKIFTETNNIRGIAWTNLIMSSLKSNSSDSNDDEEILSTFISSAALFKKSGDHWGESVAMQYSAAFEMTRGNYLKALESYDIIQQLVRNMGSDSLEGYIISMKAWAYIELNEYDKAYNLLKEATEILKPGKFDEGIAYCLQIITYYFFMINDDYNAMLLAGFCKNIFSKYNFAPWHMLKRLFKFIDHKVTSLNDEELNSAFQKGMKINVFKAPEFAFNIIHNHKQD